MSNCVRIIAALSVTAVAGMGATKHGLQMDLTNVALASDRSAALTRARQVNATIARNMLLWHSVESYQGQGNWSVIDAAVNEQLAAGVEPLFTVQGSPAWATGANPNAQEYYYQIPGDPGTFNNWVSRYAAFASTAAQRYKGRVKKWELWSEENEHFTWQPAPNPDQYVSWYRAVYQAIKSVDPSAEIAIGGLTGLAASGPTDYNGLNFLTALYARGVFPDIVAIHPYCSQNQAPDNFIQWNNNFTDIALVYALMTAHGQAANKIWLTEWGWPSNVVGESNQAAYVQRGLIMINTLYSSFVSVSTYFLDMDQPPRYYHGLYDSTGRMKAAGATYRDSVGSSGGTTVVPPPPPQSSPGNPTTRYLSDLSWTYASNGWGPVERDKSNGDVSAGDGRPLTIKGTNYPKGLGVHAPSEVHFSLAGLGCKTFLTDIGLDDETSSRGAVIFRVLGDNSMLYDSGVMYGNWTPPWGNPRTLSIDITGRNELELVVAMGPNGFPDGHADWAGARLACN